MITKAVKAHTRLFSSGKHMSNAARQTTEKASPLTTKPYSPQPLVEELNLESPKAKKPPALKQVAEIQYPSLAKKSREKGEGLTLGAIETELNRQRRELPQLMEV